MGIRKYRLGHAGSLLRAGLGFSAGGLTVLMLRQHGQRSMAGRLDHLSDQLTRLEQVASANGERDALAHQQRVHFDLLTRAIADQSLAEVLNTYDDDDDVSPGRQRQFLFANLLYVNALRAHQMGIVTRQELFGHLREIFRNQICRDYWETTRHHRATLKTDSVEGQVGLMVDSLVVDLDETDSDNWWVVGRAPSE